jgi:hypothetical protein
MFTKIKKRDGNTVEFDSSKITTAIAKAGKATGEFGKVEAEKLTMRVLNLAHELSLGPFPDVEGIQDIVERVLFDTAFFKSAKAYILYREQHAQIRTITAKTSVDLVDRYLKELDWKILDDPTKGINYLSEKEHEKNKFILPPKIDCLISESQKTRAKFYMPSLIYFRCRTWFIKAGILELTMG